MSYENNPNFERPERLGGMYAHLSLETGRFGGTPSYDGQYGGVPLFYDKERERLILDGSDTHTLVFGSTGSKKTRALVMPSIHVLAQAEESMIIHDAKGELYRRTAGMLKKRGYRVVCVNLREPETGNSWNPLTIPYRYYLAGDKDKAALFANELAITLIKPSQNDAFWGESARDCCFGLIMLLFRYCQQYEHPEQAVNMSNLCAMRQALFAQTGGMNPAQHWLWKWGRNDELIAAGLSGSVLTASETMQGILSTLDQALRIFNIQPTLLDMLANNNVDIGNIGKEKTAVFLVTPDENRSFHPLVSVFVAQSYQHLVFSAEREGGKVSRRINYLLDEFSSLSAIGSDYAQMLSASRSRNIRFLIVVQSKHQLKARYGDDAETIQANCGNLLLLFTRELDLLKEVSELCGERTNGKPNMSIFELQHLNKDKNEALLLAGRNKPCVVQLLDIKGLDRERYKTIPVETPKRNPRIRLNFTKSPSIESRENVQRINRVPSVSEQSTPPKDMFPISGFLRNHLSDTPDKTTEELLQGLSDFMRNGLLKSATDKESTESIERG